MDKRIRVYIDSSVFRGVCDDEFEVASKAFLAKVTSSGFEPVVSAAVLL